MASPYSPRLATTTGDEDAVEVQIPEQLSSVRPFLARQLVELFAAASCPLGLVGRATTFADGCARVPLDMPVARDRDPSVVPASFQLVSTLCGLCSVCCPLSLWSVLYTDRALW